MGVGGAGGTDGADEPAAESEGTAVIYMVNAAKTAERNEVVRRFINALRWLKMHPAIISKAMI